MTRDPQGRCRRDGGALERREASRCRPRRLTAPRWSWTRCSAPACRGRSTARRAQVVEALNDLPVVAIDVPSGLSGDTGQPLGGVCLTADADRHLLPQEAGACAAARARAVRRDRGRRYRHPPQAAGHASCMRMARAVALSLAEDATATNMPAAIAWWSAVRRMPPARRGWRHAARCASGQGWSASPRRRMRWRSTPRI